MAATPSPKHSPLQTEVLKIKNQIDTMIAHMQRKNDYSPTRDDLEYCAEELITLLNKYKEKTAPNERFLKTAVIDLTEVPDMAPQMQRISFLTALRDASANIDQYLNSLPDHP